MPGAMLTGSRLVANRSIKGAIMNAEKLVRFVRRTFFMVTLTTIAATAVGSFAQEATNPGDGLQRLLFGRKVFEPVYYYGWPPHRVYPQWGKITLEYAKCESLNWEIIVPNQAWKRADRETEVAHRALLLVRHNPDITISLAGERVGIEAKETNRTALIASQEKMKTLLGATIFPGQQLVAGTNIQGIAYFANVEEDGGTTHYAMWVASRNGYSYSLAVFGDKKFSPVINGEMFDFVRDLHQLDSNRVAHADSQFNVANRRGDGWERSTAEEPVPFSKSLVK
jgi:hypothetical protein